MSGVLHGNIRTVYRETNAILRTCVFRYKSCLRPNFLIVKSKLHILQRTPTFSEPFWLHEKDFEKFFVREKGLQSSAVVVPTVLLF